MDIEVVLDIFPHNNNKNALRIGLHPIAILSSPHAANTRLDYFKIAFKIAFRNLDPTYILTNKHIISHHLV